MVPQLTSLEAGKNEHAPYRQERAMLFPLLTGECGYDVPEVKNDEDLRRCATAGDEYGVIEATVDGVKIKDLDSYRTQAGYFNVTNADNNIYDSPVGTYRAFAEGYFLFLEPLPAGNHDVNLKVSVLNSIEPSFNYNADWTYHLNIVPSNSTADSDIIKVNYIRFVISQNLLVVSSCIINDSRYNICHSFLFSSLSLSSSVKPSFFK